MPRMMLDSGSVVLDEGSRVRLDVFTDTFDTTVDALERQPARGMGGKDPAIWGVARWGYFRWSVYIPLFDAVLEAIEK